MFACQMCSQPRTLPVYWTNNPSLFSVLYISQIYHNLFSTQRLWILLMKSPFLLELCKFGAAEERQIQFNLYIYIYILIIKMKSINVFLISSFLVFLFAFLYLFLSYVPFACGISAILPLLIDLLLRREGCIYIQNKTMAINCHQTIWIVSYERTTLICTLITVGWENE